MQPQPELYQSGGTLSLDLPTYVERAADHQLFAELLEHRYCFVLTARQMGKSSLIVRTQQRLRQHGIACATLDLTLMGKGTTQAQWYLGHADEIAQALGLPVSWEAWWTAQSGLGDVQRFGRFLSDVVLTHVAGDVVVFIDEIDSTIGLSYSDDYFALIRALFNRRSQDPRLQRLSFVLVGVAAPGDLIKDPQRTPFNIGRRIDLTDFTLSEAAPLLQGLAPEPGLARRLLERVFHWTGGHPYLTQRSCEAVATWAERDWDPLRVPDIVDDCIKQNFFGAGRRTADPNLQVVAMRIEVHGQTHADAPLLALYRRVLQGERVPDEDLDPLRIALKLSGLVVAGPSGLRVRNRIYATVFDLAWVQTLAGDSATEAAAPADWQHDVFVSYSADDRDWVATVLVPALVSAGLRVASDLDLLPGQDWQQALTRMRERSRYFVPVLSPGWARSRGAQEEFALSSDRLGTTVPVLLRPTELPGYLRTIQFADFTDPDRHAQALQLLLRALGAPHASPPATVAVAPAPAPAPRQAEAAAALRSGLQQRFGRDALLQLVAAHFPALLDGIDLHTASALIVQRTVDAALRADQANLLRDLIAAGPVAQTVDTAVQSSAAARRPLAFVLMPFGTKPTTDGRVLDFDRVYREAVLPGLELAGFAPQRVDEDTQSGDLRADALQALLLADLVVADVGTDQPNIWYQLGVRHSLRPRGVLLIQAQGADTRQAFDTYTDRRLRYPLAAPDAAAGHWSDFSRQLAEMVKSVLGASDRVSSPVFLSLPGLREADVASLAQADSEIGLRLQQHRSRIQVAQRTGQGGDLLLLADEAPLSALRVEALLGAAEVLRQREVWQFAVELYDASLRLQPENRRATLARARCLGRLMRLDEAEQACRRWADAHPQDAEPWAVLGQIQRQAWADGHVDTPVLLQQAMDHFQRACALDTDQLNWAGVQAVQLWHLQRHLGDAEAQLPQIDALEAAVRWALGRTEKTDPWSALSLADLALLSAPADQVAAAYRAALARFGRDAVLVVHTQRHLAQWRQAGFRPEAVEAAQAVVAAAGRGVALPLRPSRVLLFFGHMVDSPGRPTPRFPAHAQGNAAAAIDAHLALENCGAGDLGLAAGCQGGDLLFAEACLARDMRVTLLLPMAEDEFVSRYVASGGDDWRKRFYAVKSNPRTTVREQPACLGPVAGPVGNKDAWMRNNRWLLQSALTEGPQACRLLALWDRDQGHDLPGSVSDTMMQFQQRTGRAATRLDPIPRARPAA